MPTTCFNPRPPLLAGAIAPENPIQVGFAKFQSSPAIAGGRDMLCLVSSRNYPGVSILARHCWRARFTYQRQGGEHENVSILARHCWRARSAYGLWPTPVKASFNPRPPLLAGAIGCKVSMAFALYVSILARHCWRARCGLWSGSSDMGLVSILARHCWRARCGRSVLLCRATGVSILARHCWRARSKNAWTGKPAMWFQSSPAIAGGRDPSTE